MGDDLLDVYKGRLMKKLFIALAILFFCPPVWAATDFTADSACKVALATTANGGNETNLCGGGGTLTETGGTIPTSSDVPSGYSGTSRDFEAGDTEWLTQADGGSADISGANQPISICAWIKAESLSGEPTMVSKFGSLTQDQYIFFLVDRGGGWHAELIIDGSGDFGTSDAGVSADGSISSGSWISICGIYDDTDIRMYVNKSLSGTPVSYTGGIFNGTSEFRVGIRQYSDTHPFDGLMKNVLVMNRAMTSTEVGEYHDCGMDGALCASRRIMLVQ